MRSCLVVRELQPSSSTVDEDDSTARKFIALEFEASASILSCSELMLGLNQRSGLAFS